MKTKLTIAGLIAALFLSALPATSMAQGDGFNDVVKVIEQFYHVKHQSIPLLARAAIFETETIKGKNGAVVTRTTMKDGSIQLKRVSSKGDVTLEINDVYDMAAAVREATRAAEKDRPNSQTAIVWISDGIAPIFYEDRDATEKILIRSNAIFSSLTVDLRTLFKFLLPIGKPLAGWLGVSLYGSAKHLAQQSGGEALRINRTSDYDFMPKSDTDQAAGNQ